jgi:hypothetical protein
LELVIIQRKCSLMRSFVSHPSSREPEDEDRE